MNNKGIGIFDSGLGGLTVAKEIMNLLPNEKIFYLGDTARTPYGTKTKETIIRFSKENTSFLLKKNVKIIVVACNTASALALKELKHEFPIDIIGVIEAGARAAVEATQNNRVGVIGTRGTINSGAYVDAIHKYGPKVRVSGKAAPLLVPLVEEGWLSGPETESILKKYLAEFGPKKIDTLVLGCTHYPLLKPMIKKLMPKVTIIDSAREMAKTVQALLEARDLTARRNNRGKSEFFVTDTPDTFNKVGRMFMKKDMVMARKVTL
ncbi:MAG: glutamate racemase [Spirochaetia bacterium]|nr:glutamate racemase [Spirochaetia bacterium]